MTIVQELKKLIEVRGGSTAGIDTIAKAVAALTAIEEENAEDDEDDGVI